MEYRREIDGLRAVAVLPVILFHAGFSMFSGGYIGVDVFFVISGFLITSILLSEIEREDFSIVRFYERRARRILPALFLVMIVCVPVAWLLMVPVQLESFGRSLIAVSIFASNILFWREQNYFEPSAELKPLLHTWSLAVEEQYYVLFPIFLFFIWKIGRKSAFWAIVILTVISFILCQVGSIVSPIPNFYLAPTRAWELLAGSICAFYGKQRGNNPASLVGLALVVVPIFLYGHRTPFPSLYTLAPILGTALLLLYATSGTWVARLLGTRPFVGIGLISYSAYLWHQPIFAFARLQSAEEPSRAFMSVLALSALVLAYLSWKYVENPFRARTRVSRRQIFLFAGAGMATFVAIGGAMWIRHGFPERFDARSQALLAAHDYKTTMTAYGLRRCFIDDDQGASVLLANNCVSDTREARIVVFGDSEAAHLMAGVRTAFAGQHIDQWTATACWAITHAEQEPRCKTFYETFMREQLPRFTSRDTIILGTNWIRAYADLGEAPFAAAVSATLKRLSATGAKVILIGNTPEFSNNPLDMVVMKRLTGSMTYLRSMDFRPSDAILKREAEHAGAEFLAPSGVMCKPQSLDCLIIDRGQIIFFDSGHMAPAGSELLFRNYLRPEGASIDRSASTPAR